MGKTINQLTTATDARANENTRLLPLCDPTNGISESVNIGQLKAVFSVLRKKYIATGTEGVSLTIPEILGKQVLLIQRESSTIYEVSSAPDSSEFIWDGTTVTLGAAVSGAGERFVILYNNV